ncbi:response regulator transcription factor [Xanthobacter sediminis]|uniref:response regulator transcription factor n=1 Tax=Xanthobacter sediminis TaxID=3119926 RepID=UPI003729E739
MAKVLLIEDDRETAEEVVGDLRGRGHEVHWAATGPSGLDLARERAWDILVTDRLLPGRDGLSVLQELRSEGVRTPALVLSALSSVDERIRGLRAGGDDYLVKPFAFAELAARIEALLRRPAEPKETLLRVGSLELDLISTTARRGEREIDLLPREFRLLEYLMRRPGQTITRAMLFQDVWKYNFVPKSNLVDVHIGRLRHKLDAPGEPSLIENVRGVGFVFQPDA